jgi:hypothetical protein
MTKARYRPIHCILHNTLGYLDAVNNSIAQRKRHAGLTGYSDLRDIESCKEQEMQYVN